MQLNATIGNALTRPDSGDRELLTPPLELIVAGKVQRKVQAYIRGLTMDMLAASLEAYDLGNYRAVVPMWRKMARRDGHLLSVIEKRLGKLSGLDWEVNPVDDSPEAKKQADFLGGFLEDIPAFAGALEGLAEALKYGIAGREIEWLPATGPSGELRCRLHAVPPENFDATQGTLRLFPDTQAIATIEIPADKFVIHQLPIARMEPSSILYVAKFATAGFWLAFGERFGSPGLLGTHPSGASQADIDRFFTMLVGWAQENAAAIPEGYKVEPVEASGQGNATYEKLVEWANSEESKIWTGHTLTADAKSGTGTLAGTGAGDQLQDLTEADAVKLAETLNDFLLSPAVRFQFGQSLLARFHFKVNRPLDKQAEIQTDGALLDRGLDLPLSDVYRKYGWRQPAGGEAVLKGKAIGSDSGAVATAFKTGADGATRIAAALERAQQSMVAYFAPLQKLIEEAAAEGRDPAELENQLVALYGTNALEEYQAVLRDLVAASYGEGAQQTIAGLRDQKGAGA